MTLFPSVRTVSQHNATRPSESAIAGGCDCSEVLAVTVTLASPTVEAVVLEVQFKRTSRRYRSTASPPLLALALREEYSYSFLSMHTLTASGRGLNEVTYSEARSHAAMSDKLGSVADIPTICTRCPHTNIT
jgi:hypothetical protein